jgi:8-oxo-dGTP diphosphatase
MKLAVDIVVQRGHDFLFIRRKFPPFEGELALPGGFVEDNETCEAAAVRELAEETGVRVEEKQLRLIGVFSKPKRDPRQRVISVAYHVVIPLGTEAHAGDDAASLIWIKKSDWLNEPLAFDHAWIVEAAL